MLKVYSEALGIAYQIRDDLSDLGAGGETNDIAGLRPSLLLAVAHEKAKDGAKEILGSVWRRQLPAGVTFAQVETLFHELHADDRARTLLETYKEEAIRCLRDLESRISRACCAACWARFSTTSRSRAGAKSRS